MLGAVVASSAMFWIEAWADDEAPKRFDSERYLTGDWFGLRNTLYEHGIDITGGYVAEPMANPIGGIGQGATYTHNLGLQVDLDLEELIGWQQTSFRLRMSERTGRSLTNDEIGNTFSVQQIFGGQNTKLVNVQIVNSFWDDRVNLSYGRIVANDDFLRSPLYCQFLNNAFCGSPVSIFRNVPDGVTAYPLATWGFRARVEPSPDTYVMAAVYDGDPTIGGNNNHGIDWSFGDNGVLIMTELGFEPVAGLLDLPGAYRLGGWYHSGDFDELATDVNGGNVLISGLPAVQVTGNGGIYLLLDQTLYQERGDERQGLSGFFAVVVGPQPDIQVFPYFYSAGLVYEGLLDGRPADKTALGITTGWFSSTLREAQRAAGEPVQYAETVIELNHQFQITPFLYLRPDIQYVITPNGLDAIENALVVGFEVGLEF